MSNQALSFIGRLDKREEAFIMSEQQERAFLERLAGNRRSRLLKKLYGTKSVRNVYVPPRTTDGSVQVMPKN
tara:strand:+ start:663 stop:878 length:216 start_codon:yes stop_codon:yes gene_type:complete